MKTKRIIIRDRENIKDEELSAAAQVLWEGGLVVFPMKTMYRLGGNTPDGDAAKKIYAAKGRPCDNLLTAHISCAEELKPLVKEIPEAGRRLMEVFWPGPLTMIFPKSSKVSYRITGGLDIMTVRMPDNPIANRLIALAGVPIAAPSTNTSGRPSPTVAGHVRQDMNGWVEMIIGDGPMRIRMESTIVDVSSPAPAVLRPSVITMEMPREVLGEVTIDPATLGPMSPGMHLKAPGMKYKHYVSKADLTLMELEGMAMDQNWVMHMTETVRKLAEERCSLGLRVGIIYTDESTLGYSRGLVRSIGARKSRTSAVYNLYVVFKELDDLKMDFILSESFTGDYLGQVIMNHLSEAVGYKTVRV